LIEEAQDKGLYATSSWTEIICYQKNFPRRHYARLVRARTLPQISRARLSVKAERWYESLIGESRDGADLGVSDLGSGALGDSQENRDDAIRAGKIAHCAGIAVDDHVA